MLALVKIKRGFWHRKSVQVIYYLLMIGALLACFFLYTRSFVQVWGVPTASVLDNHVVTLTQSASPPPAESSHGSPLPPATHLYGQVQLPTPENYQKISEAAEKNPDVFGWVEIGGTNIDYPVLKAADNEQYLRKDAQGKYRFTGSIFADYRVSGEDRNDLPQNTVLYGHNINLFSEEISGEMFSQLLWFGDQDFAQNHQYLRFSTPSDQMQWEVFAVFYTDQGFNYNNVNPSSSPVFLGMVEEAKARSLFIYPVEVGKDDKIITLSTCSYRYDTKEEQRFTVMAKLVTTSEPIALKPLAINELAKEPAFVLGKEETKP